MRLQAVKHLDANSDRDCTQLFDRWWTIRRLEPTDNAESLNPLLREVLHLVERTDNDRVNEWLERVHEPGIDGK
jgi:hypothetical protein